MRHVAGRGGLRRNPRLESLSRNLGLLTDSKPTAHSLLKTVVLAPAKNLTRPRPLLTRPQSCVRSWPFAVSFSLHVGLVVAGTILGSGQFAKSPRAAVRYSVLQPDASPTPPSPPVQPALPPVEVCPVQQEALDEVPELPVLPMEVEPAPLPVPEDVPEPMRAQLADCAMTRIRRHEQVAAETPRETPETPPQTQDEPPNPVTAAELTAAAPSPDLGNCPAPQYPPSARRHHIQGTVVVSFEVAADGQVLSCAIFASSGYAMLDDAALEVARKWRFTGGAGRVNVPFSFVLHSRGN